MFTIKTVETPDRISVTGRGDGGFVSFAFLFIFVGWIWLMWGNFFAYWLITALTVFLGLVALFFFVQPNKIMSEFDLNKRKVFISKTHFILNLNAEEIRFEDIESIEVETKGGGSSGMKKNVLVVNLKDQPVGEDLGAVPQADELVEKLKRFIGLPD